MIPGEEQEKRSRRSICLPILEEIFFLLASSPIYLGAKDHTHPTAPSTYTFECNVLFLKRD